ncbi:hypothetical protein T4A_13455 [Trichinella pseudospiralis]|uniref:Uncharacterized protein n=1 Tax=Trichinella pseudospiralis TaxID=6337 RepID=A0A0V1E5S4_TRIPS|nr:hypothetical protein T4A_13455 [Trichinella pseudospiralis]
MSAAVECRGRNAALALAERAFARCDFSKISMRCLRPLNALVRMLKHYAPIEGGHYLTLRVLIINAATLR